MAAFTFSLEQVLAYRKQLEDQAMQALAEAMLERDTMLDKINRMEQERATQREKLAQPERLEPAEFWLLQVYDKHLQQELKSCKEALISLETIVDQCRSALVKKAQERELLDTLKEKQYAKYLQEEKLKEQRTYDETATLRYQPSSF